MANTMSELKQSLIQDLEDNSVEIKNAEYPSDLICEIVDRNVPVYFWQLLELAQSDHYLATFAPEIYAFTGEHNAVNAIAGNVYEALQEEAYKWIEENNIQE